MTTTCKNAVDSLLSCARLNLAKARNCRNMGHVRASAHHLLIAIECRRDANLLKSTAK